MVVPSLMSTRRFPDAVRIDLQVAYARAWEALTQTHEQQAVGFVRRLQGRIGAEEALQRYPREVSVPLHMQETVRVRALLAPDAGAPRARPRAASAQPHDASHAHITYAHAPHADRKSVV